MAATRKVALQKMKGQFRTEDIARITRERGVRVALLYDSWFDDAGGLPADWKLAGKWKIRRNVVNGGDTVSIYAVDPTEEIPLREHLAEFASVLPSTVEQSGEYLNLVQSNGDQVRGR